MRDTGRHHHPCLLISIHSSPSPLAPKKDAFAASLYFLLFPIAFVTLPPIPSHGIPTHFPSQCQCPAAPTLLPLPTLGLQHSRESPKLWPWCRFFCYCATTTSQLPIKLCPSLWHCFMPRMMGEFFFFVLYLLQKNIWFEFLSRLCILCWSGFEVMHSNFLLFRGGHERKIVARI